jgi:adenine-specific DNA-methyltransferase
MILRMAATTPQRLDELTREELLEILRSREMPQEGGIRITFSGKDVARKLARKVQPRVCRRFVKYSCGSEEDQARNQVVEAENLQAMVTLYRERGQVDLILTDPPYNTGNDFRYNDRWDEDPNDPELGDLVSDEDGASHTKWMKFMWPRLQMMKAMLKPGGVLAICIDHRELFRLGQMLDELFQQENRLAILNWEKASAPRPDNKHVSTSTEYVLVYAKDRERAKTKSLPREESDNSRYGNPDNDPEGLWREGNLTARTYSAKADYGIQSPITGEVHYPAGNGAWRHPKRNIRRWLEQWGAEYEERVLGDGRPSKALMIMGASPGKVPTQVREAALNILKTGPWPFVWFGIDGQGRPRVKTYLERIRKGKVPVTYWADEDFSEPLDVGCTSWDFDQSGRSSDGVAELTAIVGKGHGFLTVKPLKLFQKIIQLWSPQDGLILDPFAGSGTTGHAILALNAHTASSRRFILIEQGREEKGDSYARSLLADRLRRVILGDWKNGKGKRLGGGYRFVQLQKKVDAKALLAMERDEMTDAVIASHYDINRRGPGLILMTNDGYSYLVARNASDEGFYLVWGGSGEPPVFDDSVYEAVVNEAIRAGLKPKYHVYARFNLFQSDDVRFYQIPDQILIDFGLDINDPFNNESADV